MIVHFLTKSCGSDHDCITLLEVAERINSLARCRVAMREPSAEAKECLAAKANQLRESIIRWETLAHQVGIEL